MIKSILPASKSRGGIAECCERWDDFVGIISKRKELLRGIPYARHLKWRFRCKFLQVCDHSIRLVRRAEHRRECNARLLELSVIIDKGRLARRECRLQGGHCNRSKSRLGGKFCERAAHARNIRLRAGRIYSDIDNLVTDPRNLILDALYRRLCRIRICTDTDRLIFD